MPFDRARNSGKRIAVIGAGISGMGAAWMLSRDHRVTLYEAEPKIGGQARTVVAGKKGDQPVDTGFIVFNYANYPHLVSMFEELDVPVVKSRMSFGASLKGGALEYGLANLDAVFAQRKNLANLKFLRMLRDVMRFNRDGLKYAKANPSLTIGAFISQMKLGDWFRDYYLLPLSGAIWSTPTEKIMDFPAYAMMQFFENHALLNYTGQHQWYTVTGGSRSYVDRLEASILSRGATIRVSTPIQSVRRSAGGAAVKAWGADWEMYDEVVFATHSDDTLSLLADPTQDETATLGAIAYQPNDIVLHADTSIMPKRRNVWSSWVYTEDASTQSDRIDLTYWMNSLQPIPHDDPMFVTLNTKRQIREDLIYDQVTLRHPVYDLAALDAQARMKDLNGLNNTWYCGAWMKHGFHEDGLSSAVDVVREMAHLQVARMAAE